MTGAVTGGPWHAMGPVETLRDGEWRTEVRVPPGSAWFGGHFPGDPILPGIAQLGMVREAAAAALGDRVRLAGVSRVKFKKIIRPDDRLRITLSIRADLPGVMAFRIESGAEIACSGTLVWEQIDPAGSGGAQLLSKEQRQ
jgi:3-hydroxymyristoyl/3-hydroxydecanoyl-(acyl carrier protein) dehydratase